MTNLYIFNGKLIRYSIIYEMVWFQLIYRDRSDKQQLVACVKIEHLGGYYTENIHDMNEIDKLQNLIRCDKKLDMIDCLVNHCYLPNGDRTHTKIKRRAVTDVDLLLADGTKRHYIVSLYGEICTEIDKPISIPVNPVRDMMEQFKRESFEYAAKNRGINWESLFYTLCNNQGLKWKSEYKYDHANEITDNMREFIRDVYAGKTIEI